MFFVVRRVLETPFNSFKAAQLLLEELDSASTGDSDSSSASGMAAFSLIVSVTMFAWVMASANINIDRSSITTSINPAYFGMMVEARTPLVKTARLAALVIAHASYFTCVMASMAAIVHLRPSDGGSIVGAQIGGVTVAVFAYKWWQGEFLTPHVKPWHVTNSLLRGFISMVLLAVAVVATLFAGPFLLFRVRKNGF